MDTRIITSNLQDAADIIIGGGLVAVPTETVYGLACNGLNEKAVERIYEVKGRPAAKPLALMVHDADTMELYCENISKAAKTLAKRFWPGPLTIVLEAKDSIPQIVRAGGETIGLRCPDHPMTLKILECSALPLAAPSANPAGSQSPKTANEVMDYFSGKIEAVVDGGECGIGVESTVIDMSSNPYRILRQGALSYEQIADALVADMTIVGITGGTGCGKTTALNELEKLGALILDCDAVYHELLEKSEQLIDELDRRYPGVVTDGVLDIKALGRIVFSDENELKDLNSITHRHIGQDVDRRLRQWAMEGGEIAAIDAIELISSGIGSKCKATVGIVANREARIKRIMARDNISREYASLRVDAQKPDSYFEENCTYIARNDGDRQDFINEFHKIVLEVLNNG